jgi:6-phosphogluconolactonase
MVSSRRLSNRACPRMRLALCAALLLGVACGPARPAELAPATGTTRVYVGTYTDGGKSQGIYQLELDYASGRSRSLGLAGEAVNPAFLAVHPGGRFLYAVGESTDAGPKGGGAVNAFAIAPRTGQLVPLNQQATGGAGPVHLVVDAAGRHVLVANYGSGSVAVLPIGPDGRLESASALVQHAGSNVNPARPQGPHAHSVNLDPDNRYAFVADLGIDKVLVYRFDSRRGTLAPIAPAAATAAPGAGPRHLAVHPRGRFAYVINEMGSTVTALRLDPASGALRPIQTLSTLPPGQSVQPGYGAAEVQVHPSGRFLYASNRGHDSIAVFSVDATTGRLRYVASEPSRGRSPRHFGIDPAGRFLLAANQRSDTVVFFRIDQASGRLEPTGQALDVPAPVCVIFAPAAK